MNLLQTVTLAVVGFTACSEFGSYAFVHPVVRRLPPPHHLQVEQGLLRTFGRFMPVAMPLSATLGVVSAVEGSGWLRWAAAASLVVSVITTLAVNVGINRATGRWDAQTPPADWRATRDRWELWQAVRSWLLLAGFLLLCAAA